MFTLYGYFDSIMEGTWMTLNLALSSLLVAVILGMLAALGKLSNSRPLRFVTLTYTTIIRGIPDLVLMLLIFYGGQMLVNNLAYSLGYEEYIDINPFVAGVATIGFIFGAYMAETFRGAIMAVSKGQLEAGASYGMSRFQIFYRILLPQMIRYALPSFGNNWLVMIKATAIVSIIGLDDMVRKADLAAKATRQPFTFYILVACNYLIFTTVSSYILAWAERRYSLGERRV
ncbi:MAG: ABC transporter permease [Proteobacteria bacterium]|nr:ABC transporter permease [Pseudomonadota bacterium]